MSTLYSLTAKHDNGPQQALTTIRLTLLGLAQHGVITDAETYSEAGMTVWSFHSGTEDAGEVLSELEGLARRLAEEWELAVSITLR